MNEQQTRAKQYLESQIQDYLKAVNERDLSRCMEFYTDDATISILHATFRGRSDIEEWHKERFAAQLELVQINQVRAKPNSVMIDAVVTSNRLQSLKIGTVRGIGTFTMEHGKIKEAKFRPKMYNPLENWGVR